MICTLTLTQPRDYEMLELMLETFEKVVPIEDRGPSFINIEQAEPMPAEWVRRFKLDNDGGLGDARKNRPRILQHRTGMHKHWGWPNSLQKLIAVHKAAAACPAGSWLACIDSDVIWRNARVLHYTTMPSIDFFGLAHSEESPSPMGPIRHCSGAMLFVRASIAVRLGNILKDGALVTAIEQEMRDAGMCVNEDVVLTYCLMRVGGVMFSTPELSSWLHCDDFEADMCTRSAGRPSLVHYGADFKSFLGEPVNGKWDIPRVLREDGLA